MSVEQTVAQLVTGTSLLSCTNWIFFFIANYIELILTEDVLEQPIFCMSSSHPLASFLILSVVDFNADVNIAFACFSILDLVLLDADLPLPLACP